MPDHEYRVLPAPRRATRIKGARSPEERFARAVEAELNRLAAEGWEFVRSETLPCERRRGWFGGTESHPQTLLVFRREAAGGAADRADPERAATLAAIRGLRAEPAPPRPAPAFPAPLAPRPAARRFTPPPPAASPANATEPTMPPLTVVEGRSARGDEPAPEPRSDEEGRPAAN
ncbi:DUF4177 domain-containing protein [Rubellimicrobium sp. CFH 75288]|uniref:DUF4177 domain-containing protein n=1 Tax=Rubellimicrobium sp. CFH 75288 TaxID=2697034 RepID=UPI001AA19089|nr:DUF4177 domain-containing protein [Rubellimicrobium sp. CFH 75288]